MSLRGAEVADAYIEVHADTAAFRRELVRKAAPALAAFAKKAKTLEERIEAVDKMDFENFLNGLARASRSGDWGVLGRQFASAEDAAEAFYARLETIDRANVNLIDSDEWDKAIDGFDRYYRERKALEIKQDRDMAMRLSRNLDELDAWYKKATALAANDADRRTALFASYVEAVQAHDKRLSEAQERETRRRETRLQAYYTRLAEQYERDYARYRDHQASIGRMHARVLREMEDGEIAADARHATRLQRAYEAERDSAVRINREHDRALRERTRLEEFVHNEAMRLRRVEQEAAFDTYRVNLAVGRAIDREEENLAVRRYQRIRRDRRVYAEMFDGLKRSRNDFVHGTGVLLDFVATVVGRTTAAIVDKVGDVFGAFRAGGAKGGFGEIFSSIGSGFSSLAAAIGSSWQAILVVIVAAMSSLFLLGAAINSVIGIISGLLGILTALASSVGMAITAIVPLAGVAAGAAYGLGLMVAAFTDMDRYLPGAVAGLERLKSAFMDVDVAAFAAKIEGPLNDLLTTLADSVKQAGLGDALGGAFAQILGSLTALINSAGWKAFQTALTTTYPSAIADFGGGFSGVLSGLMSAFAAAGPSAQTLGKAFSGFAADFAATMQRMGESGQLTEFFDLAAESLIVVSDLLWSFGEALLALFQAAAPAGNDMLTTITDLVQQFTSWVSSAEGSKQIAEWMQFAQLVFMELGGVIGEVVEQFQRLDTPTTRAFAMGVIRSVGDIIGIIGNFLAFVDGVLTQLIAFDQSARAFFSGLGEAIGQWWSQVVADFAQFGAEWGEFWAGLGETVSGWAESFRAGWNEFWSSLGGAFTDLFAAWGPAWDEFWGAVGGLVSSAWEGISSGTTSAWNGITSFLSGVWAGITSGLTSAWNGIVSFLTGVWNAIRSAASSVWNSITSAISTAVGAVRSAISSAWSTVQSLTSSAWNAIRNTVTTAWNNVRSAVTTGVSNVISTVQTLPSRAASALSNVGSTLVAAGRNLIQGFINGITAMFGNVRSTLSSLTSKLTSWKGPEERDKTLLYGAGRLVIGGFIRGMESQYGVAQRSLGRFTDSLTNVNAGAGALNFGYGVGPGSRSLMVAEGAIQVTTPASDARIVAGMVLDDLITSSRIGG